VKGSLRFTEKLSALNIKEALEWKLNRHYRRNKDGSERTSTYGYGVFKKIYNTRISIHYTEEIINFLEGKKNQLVKIDDRNKFKKFVTRVLNNRLRQENLLLKNLYNSGIQQFGGKTKIKKWINKNYAKSLDIIKGAGSLLKRKP